MNVEHPKCIDVIAKKAKEKINRLIRRDKLSLAFGVGNEAIYAEKLRLFKKTRKGIQRWMNILL